MRDFDYRVPGKRSVVAYVAGKTYPRVPKSHLAAAVKAGAVTEPEEVGDAGRRATD